MTTQNTIDMAEKWITSKEVAEHFGVSSQAVLRWAHDGCPHWNPPATPKTFRFRLSEVLNWDRQRPVEEGSEKGEEGSGKEADGCRLSAVSEDGDSPGASPGTVPGISCDPGVRRPG